MDAYITPKTFNVAGISLGGVRVNPTTKSKIVPLTFNDRRFVVKVPKMSIPFVNDKDELGSKFSIEMSFRGEETNENVAELHKMLNEFDAYILQQAQEHSMEWFKKPMTKETCEFMYSSLVRKPSDPMYAPTFRVTLYKRKDKFEFDAFDENKNKIEITNPHVLKGSQAMALIQCTGIWMAGAKFGTTWKLDQIRVFPRTREPIGSIIERVASLKPSEVNVSGITFSTPKSMANGGKTIYVNNGDINPLVVDTPRMHGPFGISIWPDERGGNKFSTELSFRDADTDPEIAAFLAMINDLEARVKNESGAWFKGTQCTFSSVLRQNNVQYPATMKFTIPSADNKISIPVVDATTGKALEINEDNIGIFKGSKMTIVASCTGVWNHGTRYGISFRANKIQLWPGAAARGFVLDEDLNEVAITPAAFTDDDDV